MFSVNNISKNYSLDASGSEHQTFVPSYINKRSSLYNASAPSVQFLNQSASCGLEENVTARYLEERQKANQAWLESRSESPQLAKSFKSPSLKNKRGLLITVAAEEARHVSGIFSKDDSLQKAPTQSEAPPPLIEAMLSGFKARPAVLTESTLNSQDAANTSSNLFNIGSEKIGDPDEGGSFPRQEKSVMSDNSSREGVTNNSLQGRVEPPKNPPHVIQPYNFLTGEPINFAVEEKKEELNPYSGRVPKEAWQYAGIFRQDTGEAINFAVKEKKKRLRNPTLPKPK